MKSHRLKIKRIYLLSFLFTFHIAITSYVNSTFLSGIVSEKYVGLLYTLSSLLALGVLIKIVKILKRTGNKKLILILLILNMLGLTGIISSISPLLTSMSFILFISTNTLVLFCVDIFIEHFSDPTKTGKTRGLYITIVNVAWVISPLISALLITRAEEYVFIYVLALAVLIVMTLGLIFSVKEYKDKVYVEARLKETFRYLLSKKHLLAVISINFLLQFFFAWMVVYTPIYLHHHMGFSWEKIGIAFSTMLIPFVLLGLPVGMLVDKYHIKRRNILKVGFAIIIVSTISISFITSVNIILWSAVLFITRIGAGLIETASEIYFFDHIDDTDANILGVYRNMYPLAYIVSPIIATLIFLVLPFEYLFMILGLILLTGFYLIPKLKKINYEQNELPS